VLSDSIFPEVETTATRRLEKYWRYANNGDGKDGVLSHEWEVLYLPTSVVLEDESETDNVTIAYVQGTRYQENTPGQYIAKPYKQIADIDNLSTDLIDDPEFNAAWEYLDGVPSPPFGPVEEVEEPEVNTGEATAESEGDSDGITMKVGLSSGNRASLAATVSSLSLAMSQHNKTVYDAERAELSGDTFQPGLREDVRAEILVKVGYFIRVSDEGTRFGYTGWKAATLDAAVTLANPSPTATAGTAVYTAL
jgi:hypothetical protein